LTARVVTLTRDRSLADRLVESIKQHDPKYASGVIVVETLPDEQFCFAKNANVGIALAGSADVILVNDDALLIEPDTFDRLENAAISRPNWGIVGTMVKGGIGNPFQDALHKADLWQPEWKYLEMRGQRPDTTPICFVCVYLKRRMIDEIGPLDETFTGYGWDDADYCVRSRRAGWRTMIAGDVTVQHGDGSPTEGGRGKSWSTSFAKLSLKDNTEIFLKKWTNEPQAASGQR